MLNLDDFGLDLMGLTKSKVAGTVAANATVDARQAPGEVDGHQEQETAMYCCRLHTTKEMFLDADFYRMIDMNQDKKF